MIRPIILSISLTALAASATSTVESKQKQGGQTKTDAHSEKCMTDPDVIGRIAERVTSACNRDEVAISIADLAVKLGAIDGEGERGRVFLNCVCDKMKSCKKDDVPRFSMDSSALRFMSSNASSRCFSPISMLAPFKSAYMCGYLSGLDSFRVIDKIIHDNPGIGSVVGLDDCIVIMK